MSVKLTEYEKEVMQVMFSDGYAYDDLDSHFVTWNVEGKRARGAVADIPGRKPRPQSKENMR